MNTKDAVLDEMGASAPSAQLLPERRAPIVLDAHAIEELAISARMGAAMIVDLVQRQLSISDSGPLPFQTDELRRESLLAGLDAIGLTLQDSALISTSQETDRTCRPWIRNPVHTSPAANIN